MKTNEINTKQKHHTGRVRGARLPGARQTARALGVGGGVPAAAAPGAGRGSVRVPAARERVLGPPPPRPPEGAPLGHDAAVRGALRPRRRPRPPPPQAQARVRRSARHRGTRIGIFKKIQ